MASGTSCARGPWVVVGSGSQERTVVNVSARTGEVQANASTEMGTSKGAAEGMGAS